MLPEPIWPKLREALTSKEAQRRVASLIGARVRELRQKRNLSQERLARRTGLARVYVGEIERGEANATVATLLTLAVALHVEVVELFPPLPQMLEATLPKDVALAVARLIVLRRKEERAHLIQLLEARTQIWLAMRKSGLIDEDSAAHTTEANEATQAGAWLGEPWEQKRERAGASKGQEGQTGGGEYAPSAGVPLQGAGSNGGAARRKRGRPRKGKGGEPPTKSGTLIGLGTVAKLTGLNVRTLQRQINRGELAVSDWVDDRYAVFRREDIEARLDELRDLGNR